MRAGYHALFIPGPTNLPDRLRNAMSVPLEDQRSPRFPEFSLPLLRDVKRIFKMSSGHVFLYPGSGTGGWEAAISNTLSPGDKVLTAVFGQFSHLWADMCQRHGLNVEIIDVPWGEGFPVDRVAERLAADTAHEIKAVTVCHNETATGVTSDVGGVRKALDAASHPALLMVDGVSSIASIDFRMDEWGVDLAVTGTQKGFMLPTGLTILAASDRAIGATTRARLPRTYFSFEDQLKMNKDGFFPYTPATTLMHGLRASIDLLEEEGLENVFARHHRIAEGVRKAVDAWGLKLCAREPKWYSDTVSAIVVPEGVNSNDVVKHAFERYGLSLGGGLSKVAGKVFRIGHLGWMNELMVMQALAGAEMTLRDLGVQVEAGIGVAAAEEYYRHANNPATNATRQAA